MRPLRSDERGEVAESAWPYPDEGLAENKESISFFTSFLAAGAVAVAAAADAFGEKSKSKRPPPAPVGLEFILGAEELIEGFLGAFGLLGGGTALDEGGPSSKL